MLGCCSTRRPLVPSQLPVANFTIMRYIMLIFLFCVLDYEQRNKLSSVRSKGAFTRA